jgi:RNA polymerase sigma-70 factor (ECF subfamily)
MMIVMAPPQRFCPGPITGDSVWNPFCFAAYKSRNMENVPHSAARADDDKEIMLKIAQGDRAAFGVLYDRFSAPLYSLALRMLGNEAEAQDMLQEVFLSILSKAPAFSPERGTAFAWVVAQLRNRIIDRLRARRRRGELTETYAADLEPSGSAALTSSQNLDATERAREVRSALDQLDEEQRQVLRLAFFEGMTQSEIAEKLEEPLGTIKSRASRGMARLRSVLGYLHE